jgi:peptidoglycan pentaglycine glycine transferase (the first glycine)
VQLVDIAAKDREGWNRLVERAPAFSLMQTYEWGEFKEAEGWRPYRLAVARGKELIAGAQLLIRPLLGGVFSVAYVPRGPVAKPEDTAALEILFPAMHNLSRTHRALFLKIEPSWEHDLSTSKSLERYGFRASRHTNQPRASIVIDLTSEPEDLLSQMSRSARYNIGLASRKGVTVEEGSEADLAVFYRLLHETAERNRFPIPPFDYYQREWSTFSKRGRAILLLAKYDGQTLGARMAFACGEQAADLLGASSGELGHLKANHLLVWEAMRWAQQLGCRTYDLWGIPDQVGELHVQGEEIPTDAQGGLWGVYQFKRGFGGRVVYYVGAYDYVYSRPLYAILVDGLLRRSSVDQLAQRFVRG